MENGLKQYFRDEINGISGASHQFVDDVTFILKKMENNTLIESAFSVGLVSDHLGDANTCVLPHIYGQAK